MPARVRSSRNRRARSPSSSGSELSFEKEDPLDSEEFGEESQTCPMCDKTFKVDMSIPEDDRLPVRYAVQSHILSEHPDPDSPPRKAKAAPKKAKAAAKKSAPKKTLKIIKTNDSDDDDDEDEKIVSSGTEVSAMPKPSVESSPHIPSDSQTVSQFAAGDVEDEKFSITVKLFGGEPQIHNLSSSSTILQLRTAIATRRGLPDEAGRIVYNGCRISDLTLTFTDLGIPSGSALHYVPPLQESPAPPTSNSEAPKASEAPKVSEAPKASDPPPTPPAVKKESHPSPSPDKPSAEKVCIHSTVVIVLLFLLR